MQQLHLDVETYSSVDLTKSGAYKYCESKDFELLLLAWAFGDNDVQAVDVKQGEQIPEEVLEALTDPCVTKIAHNANFERLVFRSIGIDVPIEQWRCSATKAAYCGLPLSLGAISKALQLGEKGKMSEGRALIRFFCIPCKPTKKNGGRERNLPEHDPEKWETFKKYCARDVEAEHEIWARLERYAIPHSEEILYRLDQKINDRGVLIDLELARAAQAIDNAQRDELLQRQKHITCLPNPNSASQLKGWLSAAKRRDIKSLAKAALQKLIDEERDATVKEVLVLRQKASRTSTKKYVSMEACACSDSRARGLFKFYGASRTGRWAGRLIQLQNLKRNYIDGLSTARQAVKTGDLGTFRMLYKDVTDTLSQLIRTALIASPGKTFAVADFSAIEARVIAWLAGEQWRLDVFQTHGKIYEASAAKMFGVPIESIDKGSSLRAKGKVAELALGFQGSVGALKEMGGEEMGMCENDMRAVVESWRLANPKIVELWQACEYNAKHAMHNQNKTVVSKCRRLGFRYDGLTLRVLLPSGRCLFYYEPKMKKNRFGRPAIAYKGTDQITRKWGYLETYGGKLVENIVQGVARDLMAYALLRLDAAGFDIVMHVHDEAGCEVSLSSAPADLGKMTKIMGGAPQWAQGLPLGADGYITPFYRKDTN